MTKRSLDWRPYIQIDPDIHHGEPCIRGTRIPVAVILANLAEGLSVPALLQEYPALREEDIRAALAYAAEALTHDWLLLPLE